MNKLNINSILKEIPSVNRLIEEINPKEYNLPYPIILRVVRKNISKMRKKILKGENSNIKDLKSIIINELEILNQPSLQKVINGTEYYFCNLYNIKMNNEYWLSNTQINEMNNKINNLKIKYVDQYTKGIDNQNQVFNNQDHSLDSLMNQYANFDDCKK